MNDSVAAARARLLRGFFPEGIPSLWCPPLTHYDAEGAIDESRMAAHFEHLAPFVGGFLIPGSTGDGWELSQAERRQVLALGVEQARKLGRKVLVGALHPDINDALKLIRGDVDWLKSRFNERDIVKALAEARVCGFTICPPRGKDLTQDQIRRSLASVLELNLPTAIYQLPQITQNEMSPESAEELALQYENFIFFKDTSGVDAVALSGKNLAGIFTARGAEGDYAKWLKAGGGQYDGFLLASANCFARELSQIISDLSKGRRQEAFRLSDHLTAVVSELLRQAAVLPDGNPFANANKAIDHFFAYGPNAESAKPPRLHAGSSLPREFIRLAGAALSQQGLLPSQGYLE